MTTHARFEAFGGYAFIAVRRSRALIDAVRIAQTVVADVDATCSRFRSDSDLTRVNRHPGEWVDVDPLLVTAVRVAVEAAAQTDGLVHPLLGRPLVQLGYDRDFRELTSAELVSNPWTPSAPGRDAWHRIGLAENALRIPAGTALDLGSVGKAWSADLVATGIERDLGEPAVVSLGGDIRIAAPNGEPWRVALMERPEGPTTATVELASGGLATSSTRVRRWTRNGAVRHHIIDPRTGGSAREVWRTASATGLTCSAANTASTAAVVLGPDAPGWLDQRQVTARLVASDGRVISTGAWPVEVEDMAS